jgi:hypothetical protein
LAPTSRSPGYRLDVCKSFPTRMVAKCLHPHLHLSGMANTGKPMDELIMHIRMEENPGNRLTAVPRVRAEKDAAPIVRNQSRWSVRGVSPADTSLGAKGQTRAWFWDLMHRMAWAQQRPKRRTRECGYGKFLHVTFSDRNCFIRSMHTVLALASSKILGCC